MVSYPNQKTVNVHKTRCYQDFLQVNTDEWMDAFSALTRSGFGLYLYCSGNMNGYRFALSSQAVQNALGISDSSYRRAVEELLANGYFIEENNNNKTLHFYTTPQPTSYIPKPKKSKKAASAADAAPIFEETPAAEPDDDMPVMPHRSSSPYQTYSWDN